MSAGAGENLTVEVIGVPALYEKLGLAKGYLGSPRFFARLLDAGEGYKLLAMQAAPKLSRLLSRSVGHQVESFGTPQVTLKIGTPVKYAAHVEYGTQASPRSAANRRWMHWFSAGAGGKTIQQPYGLKGQEGMHSNFAKNVLHPGTRPQPFFARHLPGVFSRLLLAIHKDLRAVFNGGAGV